MKRKLFSIFVMLLMATMNAMAADMGEFDEYVQTETFEAITGHDESYSHEGNGVTVNGTRWLDEGLQINYGENIRITAHSYVKIVKVDLHYAQGGSHSSSTKTTAGVVDGKSIVNAYADEMTITNSYSRDAAFVLIDQIKVYYVKVNSSDRSEGFGFSNADDLVSPGDYFTVIGTSAGGGFGWNIGYTSNTLTVKARNGERIKSVDFWYSTNDNVSDDDVETNTHITSGAGTAVFDAADNRITVTDVPNATSLAITCPHDAKVLINYVNVNFDILQAPSVINVTANKVDDAYWSTFYSGADYYKAPEGTQVFAVNLDGTALTMMEIKDRVVPTGQGVVLKSNTADISMRRSDDLGYISNYYYNSLKGTGARITNPGNAYVLGYKESGGLGFYKLSSTGTIGVNKAYLVYEKKEKSEAREFFGFAETTGIELNEIEAKEGRMYDLQGCLVTNPVKGIYVVNGKKVIKK